MIKDGVAEVESNSSVRIYRAVDDWTSFKKKKFFIFLKNKN
jgi:hypothetical protein